MPAKWQQWMPFKIDAFKGSPAVQAMHPAARMGYLYLLAAAWQSDDCTIPNDPFELAELSGLGDELWGLHGARILRKFGVGPNNRLLNHVLAGEWNEARRIFETKYVAPEELHRKRSEAGAKGNAVRWGNRKCDRKTSQSDRNGSPTGTGTDTNTEKQKQKPSRRKPASDGMKHSTDPRHMACKEAIFTYYREKNSGVDPDWNGREGAALGMLLGANPKLTADGMKRLLDHRRDSEVNHSDRPGLWIPNVKSFLNGPIDRFGKPLARANGQPKPRLWKPGELAHV